VSGFALSSGTCSSSGTCDIFFFFCPAPGWRKGGRCRSDGGRKKLLGLGHGMFLVYLVICVFLIIFFCWVAQFFSRSQCLCYFVDIYIYIYICIYIDITTEMTCLKAPCPVVSAMVCFWCISWFVVFIFCYCIFFFSET
jgi:hypothetical protein